MQMRRQKIPARLDTTPRKCKLRHIIVGQTGIQPVQPAQAVRIGNGLDVENEDGGHAQRADVMARSIREYAGREIAVSPITDNGNDDGILHLLRHAKCHGQRPS